jgi:hypothetical protein
MRFNAGSLVQARSEPASGALNGPLSPPTDACSGLKDASCVEEDIATRALPGFSACQPAPPGKRCHGGAGACTPAGCAPRQRIPQQPWQQQQQNGQQQQDGQQEKDGQQQQQHRRLLDASTPNDAGGGSGSGGAAGGAGSAGRWYDERFVDGYNYLRLQVGTTPSKARVLPNFLGTSHEWGRLYEYARTGETLEAFAAIFRELGPNPVLRIGGRSQELLKGPPSDGEFEALRALSSKAGARFIVGLPLEPNDVGLAKSVMGKADAVLGPSILGFGLGNEPGGRDWAGRVGGRRVLPVGAPNWDLGPGAACLCGPERVARASSAWPLPEAKICGGRAIPGNEPKTAPARP